ncbi:MAG: transporter [Azospirillaceae bacterium]|nr:transporter [Azospirillaceae bacterium]
MAITSLRVLAWPLLAAGLCAFPAFAQEEGALREFSPDRPDKTDGPYTLDVGHVQVEADLISHNRDFYNDDGTRRHESIFMAPNIRVGVWDDAEIDLITPAYTVMALSERGGGHTRVHGWSDMTVRSKINLWGNDGEGTTALGLIPFLKIPTAGAAFGNGAFEGGIGLPFAIKLGGDWNLGTQTTLALNRNVVGDGYDPDIAFSVSLSHPLGQVLDGYVELYGERQTGADAQTVASLDMGVTWQLTANFSLDAGVNIGLSKAADDLNPFLGFTVRF